MFAIQWSTHLHFNTCPHQPTRFMKHQSISPRQAKFSRYLKQYRIFPLKKERKCHSIWMKSKFSSKRLPRRIKSRVDYFFDSEIAPAGKIMIAPPAFKKLVASARVSRFDFKAAGVPSKKTGRILSFTAGA